MRRPTSPFVNEILAVAFAIALLAAAEVVVRVAVTRSADAVHLAEVPDRLDRASDGDADVVVFVGNSTTRRDIDLEGIESGMDDAGRSVTAVAIHPDDTTIQDWVGASRHFLDGHDPDLVVVGFVSGQVADGLPLDRSRLVSEFSGVEDIDDRVREADAPDDVLEVLLAKTSRLYAERTDLADRLRDALPDYRTVARRNNEVARAGIGDGAGCCEYESLRTLVEEIGAERVVVVALPERTPIGMDQDIENTVRAAGGRFIDARSVPGVGPEQFADEVHLDQVGRDRLTTWLAMALAALPTD